MTDKMTPQQRHYCMSRISGKATKPELLVRHWLWSHGYRYRLNVKSVPGKPDIVLRKYRTAIFVNGCFWHGHNVVIQAIMNPDPANTEPEAKDSECCKIPKSNRRFWIEKIKRNMERDRQEYKALHDAGWQVVVIWECQLKKNVIEETMHGVEHSLNTYLLGFI